MCLVAHDERTARCPAGDIANGALVPVLADWPIASRDIYAIFPGTMAPKAKVRLFIDYLQAHVA